MLAMAACCCAPRIGVLRGDWRWEQQLCSSSVCTRQCRRPCVVARFSGGGRGRGGFPSFGGGRGRGRGGRGRGDRDESSSSGGTIMNEDIRAPFLRLVGEDQQTIGVVPRELAFQKAAAAELDLVIVAADADPPVAKIMDFSKYKYEQQKKKRDQQKKAAATRVELKEIKMRYNIDTHDYEVRLKQAQRFLKDGDKVKLFMPFRGREVEFKNLGLKLLRQFETDLGDLAVLETKATDEGRTMSMTFAPSKAAKAEKGSSSSKPAEQPPKSKDDSSASETTSKVAKEEEVSVQ